MSRTQDLAAAVEAGVISDEQSAALATLWGGEANVRAPRGPAGEEDLRFIRNFHDVFLSIGLGLFAAGLVAVVTMVTDPSNITTAAGASLGAAGVMWLLGEYFARTKRLFLPAIVIAVTFTGFVVVAVASLTPEMDWNVTKNPQIGADIAIAWMRVATAGLIASLAFYARFRLPFSLALVALSTAGLIFGVLGFVSPLRILGLIGPLLLASGGAAFLLALAFDARDPNRQSRFSDNAFWLHLVAAPQILFGLIITLFGVSAWQSDPSTAAAMLAIVAALSLVALAINRRALVVSGLTTTAYAVTTLISQSSLSGEVRSAAALLLLGGGVVLLGAGWHATRRGLLTILPSSGFGARFFPPELPA